MQNEWTTSDGKVEIPEFQGEVQTKCASSQATHTRVKLVNNDLKGLNASVNDGTTRRVEHGHISPWLTCLARVALSFGSGEIYRFSVTPIIRPVIFVTSGSRRNRMQTPEKSDS
jgi:hypothetical protein